MPARVPEKIEWLDAQIRSRRDWLETHGPGTKKPWPEHDIEAKQRGLEMLLEIREDYAKSLERARQRAEQS